MMNASKDSLDLFDKLVVPLPVLLAVFLLPIIVLFIVLQPL
jgi:hypothetical protein